MRVKSTLTRSAPGVSLNRPANPNTENAGCMGLIVSGQESTFSVCHALLPPQDTSHLPTTGVLTLYRAMSAMPSPFRYLVSDNRTNEG